MNIFYRAVYGSIYKKLEKLSKEEVGSPLMEEFEHVLILLDVMDRMEKKRR